MKYLALIHVTGAQWRGGSYGCGYTATYTQDCNYPRGFLHNSIGVRLILQQTHEIL